MALQGAFTLGHCICQLEPCQRIGKRILRTGTCAKIEALSKEGWQSLVECTGLENRHTFTRIVGSNPTPSAKQKWPRPR